MLPPASSAEPPHLPITHLFTVRVWEEDVGEGRKQWRGQVRNLASGETRFFTGWEGLQAMMKAMVENPPVVSNN